MITSLTEMANPWIHKAYYADFSKVWSRIMIAEAVTLSFASIVLLMAVYEDRPTLLLGWLVINALEIVVTLGTLLIRWPFGEAFAVAFWHVEAMSVQAGIFFYMFLVVFNNYLDTQGTGRSLLGYELSNG